MATDDSADLSANLYVGGHTIIACSRVFMKASEIEMQSKQTGFIHEMLAATGHNTLICSSETPYRGGKWLTIFLKTV